VVVVDSLEQCAVIGDLKRALQPGLLTRADMHAEPGKVIALCRPLQPSTRLAWNCRASFGCKDE
jgi:hypothetical protein